MYVICVGGLRDDSGTIEDSAAQEAVDYEVPEKIKTLHHLALQYVNQVRLTYLPLLHCAL